MKRFWLVVSVVFGGQLAWAAPALAQTPAPNAGNGLKTLIALGAGDGSLLVAIVVNLVRTEISTFPTASSSAGFVYAFDPASACRCSHQSFGRCLSSGRSPPAAASGASAWI